MTHDYKRNGTTTLLAVLNIATGQLIGKYFRRNPYEELLALLKLMDRETWFRDITTARIRSHSFASVGVMIEAIEAYIVHHKENPSPFILTKTAEEISHGGPVGIEGPGAGGTDPSTSAGSSDDPVIAPPEEGLQTGHPVRGASNPVLRYGPGVDPSIRGGLPGAG